MSTRDEIEEYLQGKKLRNIDLPQDSNSIDQGEANAKEVKIGQKSSLARALYIQERDRRIQYGDKQAINEYMVEATKRNEEIKARVEQSRADYDLRLEAMRKTDREARITQADRDKEKEDLDKLYRKQDKEVANLLGYFNCPEEEWQKWLSDNHELGESPANVLIGTGEHGFYCNIHRYESCIPFPDGRLASCAFTIAQIEDHIKKDRPEVHKAAIIDNINEKYDKLIQARKEKTLEDKELAFKKDIREIDSIKTRPGGDYGLLNSGKKISKNERAKIRRQEQEENERNRKIYRGLY